VARVNPVSAPESGGELLFPVASRAARTVR
jgi:hypothetical protein